MTAVAQQLKRWLADPVDSLAGQVPRALVAAALAALVDCAVLFFLVHFAGWDRVPAAVSGYLAGTVVQYLLCSYWVFGGAPGNSGFLTFAVLSVGGLGITWLTMAALAGAYLPLAKSIALGLAFSWNFLSRKYLLFRPSTAPASE